MNGHRFFAALLCLGALSACGEPAITDITEAPAHNSRIKFFHFGPSAPGVNFYANDTKMSAIVSTTGTESTTGTAYSGVSAGGAYSVIAPGQYTLTGRIAATTDKDLVIASVPATIGDGAFYSFYVSGIYNSTTKTSDAFIVVDPVVPPTDFTVATVRFVHAISNANPMTLYARDTLTRATGPDIAVGGEVAYKNAGVFTSIPAGVYDLSTRYAGAATNAMTRTSVTFAGGRVYTITARGDITVAPTSACLAANRTCLDLTANR
ncbi:MAG: DUF4397 domain-containing protein [Gemmatimonadaceae bacterium]